MTTREKETERELMAARRALRDAFRKLEEVEPDRHWLGCELTAMISNIT
jgi:hypothetical protein